MKKVLVLSALFILCLSGLKAQSAATGCLELIMSRRIANYFASAVGYNGQGALPELSTSVFENMMTDDLEDYFKNSAPMCQSCYSSRSYSSRAVCNAYLQYYNLFTYDQNRIMGNLNYIDAMFNRKN